MKGDASYECPWPHAASSCITAGLQLNREPMHASRKKRGLRPHSSPVRRRELKSQILSSPTTLLPSSPSQVFPQSPSPTEVFTPPRSPKRSVEPDFRPPFSTSPSLPTSIVDGALNANTAHFSSRPPPVPLMLVPVSMSPTIATTCDCTTIINQKKPHEKTVRMVRTLLNGLVNMLPVLASSSPRSTAAVHNTIPVSGYKHSRLSSESSLGGYGGYKCHVATQAHTNENLLNERTVSSCGSLVGSADEWLGGVRALRDSHVRLVLRQLRHIERLNRALDRVRYPPLSKTPCVNNATVKDNTYR